MCRSYHLRCWNFVIVLVLCWYNVIGQQQQGSQPQDDDCVLIMENSFKCDSGACLEFFNLDNFTVLRVDESTTKMNGHIIFLKGMEQPTKVRIMIEKCDVYSCKVAMTYEITDFCNEIDNEESPYHTQLMNIDLPQCPIPPGVILFNEVELNTSNLPVNTNNRGRYKAVIKLFDGNSLELAILKFGFEIDCE